jgi:VanZ family protein
LAAALRTAFWVALAVALAVATRPAAPETAMWDKLQHFLAYAALALLGRVAYPKAPWWLLAGGLAAHGLLIELLQGEVGRHRDLYDWLADCAGILATLALLRLLRGRR